MVVIITMRYAIATIKAINLVAKFSFIFIGFMNFVLIIPINKINSFWAKVFFSTDSIAFNGFLIAFTYTFMPYFKRSVKALGVKKRY